MFATSRAPASQTRLVALIRPDHLAARRVAEKIGRREGAVIVFDEILTSPP